MLSLVTLTPCTLIDETKPNQNKVPAEGNPLHALLTN